jgi:hypothetical protein
MEKTPPTVGFLSSTTSVWHTSQDWIGPRRMELAVRGRTSHLSNVDTAAMILHRFSAATAVVSVESGSLDRSWW